MKAIILLFTGAVLVLACQAPNPEQLKAEVYQTEKEFEKMAAEKGIAEAFYHFAAEQAVIKRQNDTLITGKDSIKKFYDNDVNKTATVNWTPDFIDVSADGTLAYTYGKYVWKIPNEAGAISEYRGVFHTVWKKQEDGAWKYVWD